MDEGRAPKAAKTVQLTREELYEQVWSTPMQRLAERYGVSDVALAKTCRKHIIPVPTRGYWRCKETGREPARPLLPRPRPGAPTIVTLSLERRPEPPPRSSEVAAREAHEALPENRIQVAERLSSPHPLVRESAVVLQQRRSGGDLIRPWRSDRCLDVRVTPPCVSRALRILDALFKAFEKRDIPIRIVTEPKRQTQITLFGEKVDFWLEEQTEARPHSPTKEEAQSGTRLLRKWDHVPSGRLRLRIGNHALEQARRTWSDGPRARLEDRLNDFVVGLTIAAEGLRARTLYWQRWHEQQEEARRQHELAEQRRKAEEERIRVFDRQVDGWLRAQQVRAFVEEAERRVTEVRGVVVVGSELGDWLAWARRYADRIDPFTPESRRSNLSVEAP
jgi:hypothetical protein